VLFVGFVLFAWNNPASEFALDRRLGVIPQETFLAVYERFFTRESLGIGRLLNVAVFLIVTYALLTRFWRPVERAVGWLLVPLGQATLYVFILHVFFAYVVMSIPVFMQGNVALNTVAHTVVLLLLWWMVRREVLFRWIPR